MKSLLLLVLHVGLVLVMEMNLLNHFCEYINPSNVSFQEADKFITKMLKEKGRLVHQSQYNHSYPFCWRSETPLIYKAVPSWFIRVETLVEQLLANNKKSYW